MSNVIQSGLLGIANCPPFVVLYIHLQYPKNSF